MIVVAGASLGYLAALCATVATVSGAVVGLVFRGAASAWREERDAAIEKAERLESKVNDQAAQILTLEAKVADLEKRTDYDRYAERSARDHKQILDSLAELIRGLHANTTATEFLIKQAFGAVAFPGKETTH